MLDGPFPEGGHVTAFDTIVKSAGGTHDPFWREDGALLEHDSANAEKFENYIFAENQVERLAVKQERIRQLKMMSELISIHSNTSCQTRGVAKTDTCLNKMTQDIQPGLIVAGSPLALIDPNANNYRKDGIFERLEGENVPGKCCATINADDQTSITCTDFAGGGSADLADTVGSIANCIESEGYLAIPAKLCTENNALSGGDCEFHINGTDVVTDLKKEANQTSLYMDYNALLASYIQNIADYELLVSDPTTGIIFQYTGADDGADAPFTLCAHCLQSTATNLGNGKLIF